VLDTWAISGKEGDQRPWFIVDELDALGTIDGLKDGLARLRKFGGREHRGTSCFASNLIGERGSARLCTRSTRGSSRGRIYTATTPCPTASATAR
jgi:hypothetical protein